MALIFSGDGDRLASFDLLEFSRRPRTAGGRLREDATPSYDEQTLRDRQRRGGMGPDTTSGLHTPGQDDDQGDYDPSADEPLDPADYETLVMDGFIAAAKAVVADNALGIPDKLKRLKALLAAQEKSMAMLAAVQGSSSTQESLRQRAAKWGRSLLME